MILDKVDENQLFVPAFQREYVWKREDAKLLMDSLIKDYPTGTMLTWETNNPPELKGGHVYDERQGQSAYCSMANSVSQPYTCWLRENSRPITLWRK